MPILHITNGDSTVGLLKAANVEGDMLPWRDVLHMGPVPSNQSLQQLSIVRASFLASLNCGDKAALLADFQQRDNTLESSVNYEKILLWFEHDLYDQLQLLQLLDWFNQHKELLPKLWLINPNKHLGYHTVEEVPGLLESQKQVSQTQLSLATQVWQAFTQPTPEQLVEYLEHDLNALPHLKTALKRTLAELPSPNSGLNQTEEAALKILHNNHNKGGMTKIELFRQYNRQEDAAFHGDMGFFWYLDQLLNDLPELITTDNEKLLITPQGIECISTPSFCCREYNAKQWLGGYALGQEKQYYWDAEKQQLTQQPN